METDKHYFTVGLYIIGLSLLLAGFAMWLAGSGASDDVRYRIFFRESVSGLVQGGPVKYRGVDVGRVESITIDPRDPRRIKVDVMLGKTTPVKTDTKASLKLQGITGAVYIELTGGAPSAAWLHEVSSRDVPVIPSEASSIAAVINQLPQVMDKLSRFADQLNKLASDESIENLQALFRNTSQISSDVSDIVDSTKQDSKRVLINMRKATRDINEVTETVKENPSALLFPPEDEGIPPP